MNLMAEIKDVGLLLILMSGLIAISIAVTAPILTIVALKFHRQPSTEKELNMNMNGWFMRFYWNEKMENRKDQPRNKRDLFESMIPASIFLTLMFISFIFIIYGFWNSLQGG